MMSTIIYEVTLNKESEMALITLHELTNEETKSTNLKLDIYLVKKFNQVFFVPTSLLIPKCMANLDKNIISSVPGFFISLQG